MRTARVLTTVCAAAGMTLALGTAPASAVTGTSNVTQPGGQVSVYVDSQGTGDVPSPATRRCGGTLIAPTWVLTARHCFLQGEGTEDDTVVVSGTDDFESADDTRARQVLRYDRADVALVELESPAQGTKVAGYTMTVPYEGSRLGLWGLGGASPGDPMRFAALEVVDSDFRGGPAGRQGRILTEETRSGELQKGDSGSGLYSEASTEDDPFIAALLSCGGDEDCGRGGQATSVPTGDVSDWIERESGVAPHTFPDSSSSSSGKGGRGRGSSGANTGAAFADQITGVQNADADVREKVKIFAEAFPQFNVIAIQQETYDGPVDIRGVRSVYSPSFGDNTWDIWVFESGTFTNTGDLGFDNWVWRGNDDRSEDGRTVTFSPKV